MLEELVEVVLASAKYRHLCPETVRRLGARELANRRNLKEAIKETKNRLHQIAGAYLDNRPPYGEWERQLQAAASEGEAALRECCGRLMAAHASTRERLPFLTEFYATLWERTGPIASVLDVGCGLNPLALPWMGLSASTSYYACDLYGDMMAFLNTFFNLIARPGEAFVSDLLASPPTQLADIALLLKVLPPLEQQDKAAGLRLLHALNAPLLFVTFPTRTLGGRHKAMASYYETHFRSLIANEPWTVERLVFPNEIGFLVGKAGQ